MARTGSKTQLVVFLLTAGITRTKNGVLARTVDKPRAPHCDVSSASKFQGHLCAKQRRLLLRNQPCGTAKGAVPHRNLMSYYPMGSFYNRIPKGKYSKYLSAIYLPYFSNAQCRAWIILFLLRKLSGSEVNLFSSQFLSSEQKRPDRALPQEFSTTTVMCVRFRNSAFPAQGEMMPYPETILVAGVLRNLKGKREGYLRNL